MLLCYEEAIGFCVGGVVNDKDGVAAAAVGVAFRRLRIPERAGGSATLADVRTTLLDGLALAMTWGAAPLLFARYTAPPTELGLWMVLSVLMIAAALALAPLMLATLAFIGLLAVAIAIPLMSSHAYVAAAATTALPTLLAPAVAIAHSHRAACVRSASCASAT